MGIAILELVLQKLREGGFRADLAYPGQRFSAITAPVAAVHIKKVERASQKVTVAVDVLVPAAMGGSGCEKEALGALEILHEAGADCVQDGCSYDPNAQVYRVTVQAVFIAGGESAGEAGARVYINGVEQIFTESVTAEKTAEHQPQYKFGSSAPVGIREGAWLWEISLEERIPVGAEETAEQPEPFALQIVMDGKTETYSGCRWSTVRREFSQTGLRRVRKGIAALRTEG